MQSFSKIKENKLSTVDLSKKGSIDESIVHLVDLINDRKELVTTSSCSGRIIVVSQSKDDDSNRKKGCNWILASHSAIQPQELVDSALNEAPNLIFKFEPFILHVQCERLEDAQKLHFAAMESGFRNSGITIGKRGKIMMAVRSTHGLEVPLSCGNQLMVSTEYLHFLAKIANEKMVENERRVHKFKDQICRQFSDIASPIA